MKAIVVIDLHEDFEFPAKADIKIKTKDKTIFRTHMKLKPMPQRKNTNKLQDFGNAQIVWIDKTIYRNEGWNACIDEIMGETE